MLCIPHASLVASEELNLIEVIDSDRILLKAIVGNADSHSPISCLHKQPLRFGSFSLGIFFLHSMST